MRPILVVLVVAGAAVLPALGQSLVPSAQVPPLRRIEPGVSDVGPLSTARRVMPLDLRVNKQWEGVYSFEHRDRYGHTTTWFTRSDGGLTAVFPRSEYLNGPGGLFAQIPAGTTFIIGSLDEVERARPPAPKAFNAVNLSANQEAEPEPEREPSIPRAYERVEPSIWTSDRFRRERLERLLESVSVNARGTHPD